MAYALLAVAAFPTVLAAAWTGIVVSQDHSDPRPLAIILVAGSLLGFGAALLCAMVLDRLERLIGDGACGCGLATAAAFFWVGPAVTLLVGITVEQWW